MNRRVLAATLAAVPLAFALGSGTAAAQPPAVAPPLSSITTPLSTAPTTGRTAAWGFDNGVTLAAFSCKPVTDRMAWTLPLTQKTLRDTGGVAGFSSAIPIIDTTSIGKVEWAAYGPDPSRGPLVRSGCVDEIGQTYLNWGNPEILARAFLTPPPATAKLAILPGEPAPAPTMPPNTTTPAPTATPAAPTADQNYYARPDTATNQAASDSGGIMGGGILGVGGGAVALALLTLALVGLSRGNARRMRAGLIVVTVRGLVIAGLAVLTGLIATATAATGVPGYMLAGVLAVAVGWTVATAIASREGHAVPLRGVLTASRGMQGYALGGLLAGAAVGYVVAGSSLTSPAEGYAAIVGLCVGGGLIALRQARAARERWLNDAELVADLMAVPVRAITELDEVHFAAQADGGLQVLLLNQAARQHLPGLAERIVQSAPHLEIVRADRDGVILVPASAETVAARESVAQSGGLVGGAHAGSDPWAGQPVPETPATPHPEVDMRKPGTPAGSGDEPIDLSSGWD